MSTKSPNKKRKGVFVAKEIQDYGLISKNFDESCLKPASYDMRLGCEAIKASKQDQSDDKEVHISKIAKDSEFVIDKFESIIVSTYEHVKIPNNVVAKFNLRYKLALKGLLVQMGTQVEPGYEGPLFALLQNLTNKKITLKPADTNDRLFTIEFQSTTINASAKAVKLSGLNDIFPNGSTITGTIHTVTESLEAEQKKIKKLEKHNSQEIQSLNDRQKSAIDFSLAFKIALLSLVITVLITVVAPIALKSATEYLEITPDQVKTKLGVSLSDIIDKNNDHDTMIRDMSNELNKLKKELTDTKLQLSKTQKNQEN